MFVLCKITIERETEYLVATQNAYMCNMCTRVMLFEVL